MHLYNYMRSVHRFTCYSTRNTNASLQRRGYPFTIEFLPEKHLLVLNNELPFLAELFAFSFFRADVDTIARPLVRYTATVRAKTAPTLMGSVASSAFTITPIPIGVAIALNSESINC